MEGWLSGPKRGSANPLSRKTRTGSNPVPSARKAELKYSTLAKIEGDFVKKPGVQMIVKIAKVLGVSVEDLLK